MTDRLEVLDTIFNGLKFKDATYAEGNNTCTLNFLYNPECFKPDEDKRVPSHHKKAILVNEKKTNKNR